MQAPRPARKHAGKYEKAASSGGLRIPLTPVRIVGRRPSETYKLRREVLARWRFVGYEFGQRQFAFNVVAPDMEGCNWPSDLIPLVHVAGVRIGVVA